YVTSAIAAANQNNGTYLLAVTPDRRGLIPDNQVQELAQIGQARGIAPPATAVPLAPVRPNSGGLVTNASFESSTGHATSFAAGVDGGWSSSGNVTVATTLSGTSAPDGSNDLLFNGGHTLANGRVWKTLATIPGQTYSVFFNIGVEGQTLDIAG